MFKFLLHDSKALNKDQKITSENTEKSETSYEITETTLNKTPSTGIVYQTGRKIWKKLKLSK